MLNLIEVEKVGSVHLRWTGSYGGRAACRAALFLSKLRSWSIEVLVAEPKQSASLPNPLPGTNERSLSGAADFRQSDP